MADAQVLTKDDIDLARKSGQFTPSEITQEIDKQRPLLMQQGFKPAEIDEYYGVTPFNDKPIKTWFKDGYRAFAEDKDLGKEVLGIGRTDIPSFGEYFNAGMQNSVSGLLARGKVPDVHIPEDSPLAQRVVMQGANLAGDFPFMVGGGAITAEGGPIIAAGGALGLPQGLRKVLMDGYTKGDINSFSDFWDRVKGAVTEEFKGFVTGAATAGAGKFAPGWAKLPSEIATMTSVGDALNGKVPEPQEFLDGAILVAGMHAAGGVSSKMRDVYSETGKGPIDILKESTQDPTIQEDILSSSAEIPRAYKPLQEKPALETQSEYKSNSKELPGTDLTIQYGYQPSGAGLSGGAGFAQIESLPQHFLYENRYENGELTSREYLGDDGRFYPISEITKGVRPQGFESLESVHAEAAKRASETYGNVPENPNQPADTPENRVLAQISIGESQSKGISGSDIYKNLVDDLHPLKKAVQDMAAGKKLNADEDPYKLARLSRGVNGKAEHFLEYGTFDFKDYREIGPSFRQVLEPVKNDLDNFRAYIASKRTLELQGRGIETGINSEDAKATVKTFDKKFSQAHKNLLTYQDQTLKYLKDSGILSEDAYTAMKEASKDYVPFFRVMDTEGGKGLGKGFQAKNPIKSIEGSERQIVDPLESVIKNTYLYINLAERNNVAKTLVELASRSPEGSKFISKADTKFSVTEASEKELAQYLKPYEEQTGVKLDPGELAIFRPNTFFPKENQVVVYENGKRTLYDVDPDLARTLKALDTEGANTLLKILGAPVRTLRAGVTLNPDFMLRNIARDQLTAFVFSEGNYIPIIDAFRGLGSIAGKDQAFRDWLKSGGANSNFVSLDRMYLQEGLQKLLTDSPVRNELKNPLKLLRVMSELSENATRVGEYKKVSRGTTTKEGILQAGFSSREVTLDFARVGAKTRAVNQIIAFWNATVQGQDRAIRAFTDKPFQTTAKVVAGITVPSVLLYLANKDDQRYKDLPQWQKDLYWIVLTDEHIYRIPKPFELGLVFGTGAERFTDYILSQDPKAFDGFLAQMGHGAAPGMLPTVAAPFIETWANKSLFTDAPIIPADREGMLPEYQYTPYTSELTKKMGSLIATLPGMKESKFAAPANIDTFIRGWSGGLGTLAVTTMDYALRKAGALPTPNKPASTLADIPVIKAFVVRYPSMSTQPISDFYDRYDSNQMALTTIKKLAKEGKGDLALHELSIRQGRLVQLTKFKQGIDNAVSTIRMLDEMPGISPQEKRQLIDKIYFQVNEMARQGNATLDALEQQTIH